MGILSVKWLAPVTAAALLSCSGAAAADTPAFGIYAYDPGTWSSDIASQFPIVFVQYHSWSRNKAEIQQIKNLASAGSRVIVDFEFLKTRGQRAGRQPMPALDDTLADADYLLRELNGVPIEAITIDEENLTSPERLKRMSDLHVALKKAYPDRQCPMGAWRGNGCDRSFYAKLSSSLLPYVRQHSLPLQVPATKPQWMPTYC
jgi:hypothetical protein